MTSSVVVAFDCATDATCAAVVAPERRTGWEGPRGREGPRGWEAERTVGDAPGYPPDTPRFHVVSCGRDESGARHGGGILLPLLQRLLLRAEASQEDIAALVVGTGPGTFTGVRIAVATARALALALNRPVYGVSTLQALAAQALALQKADPPKAVGHDDFPSVLVPVVDARRGQVFAAAYRPGSEGKLHQAGETVAGWRGGEIVACAPEDIVERLAGGNRESAGDSAGREAAGRVPGTRPPLLVGTPALLARCAGSRRADTQPLVFEAAFLVMGQERLHEGATLLACLSEACRAAGGAAARGEAGRAPRPGAPGSPEAVVPLYVRAPDADAHILKMRDPWAER